MHIHTLTGCAPAPLAHYLKALGILRVVGEQADPQVRGWWEGDTFRLASAKDAAQLASFFLTAYSPAAFVSPWNRGSGFYKPGDPGLTPVVNSKSKRFEPFRCGIQAARHLLGAIESADQAVRTIKQETKLHGLSRAQREALRQREDYKARLATAERHFKSLKADLIQAARAAWRGPHLQWMSAAVVIDDQGEAKFPALLGTGGTDGNLDFTNNFMQRLNEVFALEDIEGGPRPDAASWLSGALWGLPSHSCLSDRAVGQYLPGMAGGANSSNGADGQSLLNPFDFLLMMEGSLVFAATAVRRFAQKGPSRAAAPFVVSSHAAGYSSASPADETARGEQWMPLWSQPMTLPETQRLFAEGRAQVGASSARDAMDLASAAAGLGVARGVVAFQRFGYIERNGQSNLAVPLGKFKVLDEPSPELACLDDLGDWLRRLRRQARDKGATSQLVGIERELARQSFELLQHPGQPMRWQALLEALANVEAVMRTGSGFKAQPIPPLRPEWVTAADDGSPEFRLALSFALQAKNFYRSNGKPTDGVRRHWLPLDRSRPGRFATSGDITHQRLSLDAGVVMQGRDGITDAIAMLERRLVEAAKDGQRTLPLRAAPRAWAHPSDLAAWVAGEVDADRTLALARALMALDRGLWAEQIVPLSQPLDTRAVPDDAFLVLRLAHLNGALPQGQRIPCDAAILRRLASGDAATAVVLALRRLRAAGLRCTVQAAAAPAHTARLWAAALAFPIHPRAAQSFARRLDPSFTEETFA